MASLEALTSRIKRKAGELGFDDCRIAKAQFLDREARQLEEWLRLGMHGKMEYMERYFDLRTDPRKLVDGAKSVIILSHNYFPGKRQVAPDAPKISKYAYGRDYHKVLKKKLKKLLAYIQQEAGQVQGRAFVDSAPVLEKAWAVRAGIGWQGKHTNVLTKRKGSFYFLAELIIDLALAYDPPVTDHCGTCTRCIDACPTGAIVQPYLLDSRKCISYLTIELRDSALPAEFAGKMEDWAFGCDICQDVCPWNRFAQPHHEPAFDPLPEMLSMTRREWEEITEEVFDRLFRHTPVKRAGYKGLKRNLMFLRLKRNST